jgi:transcriptional antiterminator Rof (Rho-off)
MEQQEPTGRCDFLDVLEEAAHFKRPVQIELRDGQRFTASVQDVVTADGEDYVVFAGRDRVAVSQIVRAVSTLDHDPHSYDEKL